MGKMNATQVVTLTNRIDLTYCLQNTRTRLNDFSRIRNPKTYQLARRLPSRLVNLCPLKDVAATKRSPMVVKNHFLSRVTICDFRILCHMWKPDINLPSSPNYISHPFTKVSMKSVLPCSYLMSSIIPPWSWKESRSTLTHWPVFL